MGENAAAVERLLNLGFGATSVHLWPDIPRTKPRWWQWRARGREGRINAALTFIGTGPITEEMRRLYWIEVRRGQDIYEDAGGYCLRCWWAALGLPFTPHQEGYRQAAERLVREARHD